MNFANIGWLWSLLPLGGAIVALYLLKMRRKDVRVPATFLWPAKTEEVRANSLFQRLKFSWLMVLQLFALAALAIALAQPQTKQVGLAGSTTVYVVDASASMGATDISPTRFESATRQVEAAIRGSKAGERFAVIEAGAIPRVASSLTGDSARAIRGLESVRRTDGESDVSESLRLASALVGDIDGARIVLLSDGVFAPIENFSRGKSEFVYQRIGESSNNLSISAFGVSEAASGRQLLISFRNYGSEAQDIDGTIYVDGKAFAVPTGTVEAGKTWSKTIPAPSTGDVFEARLNTKDALIADDYAVAITMAGANLRVLIVGEEDPFLERALLLDPRVTLDRSKELPPGADDQYDIVVFDGVAEKPVRARGVLALGVPGDSSPVKASGTVDSGPFISAEEHPLLKGVDLESVFFEKQVNFKLGSGAKALAENRSGPLVAVRESSAFRQVFVGFSPLDSDFPLQVSFPIFIANALTYLGGEAGGSIATTPGRVMQWPATGDIRLKTPESEVTVKPREGTATIREIDRVGHYELVQNQKARKIYASLRSPIESDIRPRDVVTAVGGEAKSVAMPVRFADWWRPVLLLCLVVLAFEWWLFGRKS